MKKTIISIFAIAIFATSITGGAMKVTSSIDPIIKEPNVENLAIQLGVPSNYQSSWVSKSGISEFNVDANIYIPDVSSVDIVQAIPRVFDDEELLTFIDRYEENFVWTDIATQENYDGSGFKEVHYEGVDYESYELWIANDDGFEKYGDDSYSIKASYYLNKSTNKIDFYQPYLEYSKTTYAISESDILIPLENNMANDCTISFSDAKAFADAEVKELAPDYQMTSYGQQYVHESSSTPQLAAAPSFIPQYYMFRYTRHLNGIPINDQYGGEQNANASSHVSGLGVITVAVRDDGVCFLNYSNPYDLGETIEKNVELLSFEQIIDILSTIGPIQTESLEPNNEDLEKNIRNVYEIAFGYMSVPNPNNLDEYLYIPVWDFYTTRTLAGTGTYTYASDSPPLFGSAEITINATNGAIIDRNLGY